MRHMPFGRACEQPKVPLLGHNTAHGGSIGARLARQGICCPIWADGDDGKTATVNAKRSLDDFGVACTGVSTPRRIGCTPSDSGRVALCPTLQQRPNLAPGPLPGPSDCQDNGC